MTSSSRWRWSGGLLVVFALLAVRTYARRGR